MMRKITHEMLEQVRTPSVRIAAAYGAGVATLRKLGATDEELNTLGFSTEAPANETPTDDD